jgi:flavoprotein
MTPIHMIVAGAIAATLCANATAQFVKGNEAVRDMPDGTKKVETPPTAGALLTKPCPASDPACWGAGWVMVETKDGLSECTEFYARRGTCRASTYGAQKFSRRWIVKKGGEWLQCQFPDLGSKCVSIKALPYGAVQ